MSIYKPQNICGRVATELKPELYRSWGAALGRQVEPKSKFVVGGDVRASTPGFLTALSEGLCSTGVDLVDLGLLPTPMIHYAKRRLRAAGCAIVTASHLSADLNGLQWMLGDDRAGSDQVGMLAREVEAAGSKRPARPSGTQRTLDVSFDYVAWLQECWLSALDVRRRVIVDPGHGTWAAKARQYLQTIFPGCLVSAIRDTPNREFAGSVPDCSQPELLEELCDAVDYEKADLGIAFDGDGDQVAFVDNEGTALSAEEAAWVLLQSCSLDLAGQPFVYDLKYSDRIPEGAVQLGAQPLVARSGHAFLVGRMREVRALFGAATSGHYFHRALEGGDDSLFTACAMIAHLARSDVALADLRRRCPPVFVTPDLRIPLTPRRCEQVIGEVGATWSEYEQTTIDGVRIRFPGGWALTRESQTEPGLAFRFEAADWAKLRALVSRFCEPLGDVGKALWAGYQVSVEGDDPRGPAAACSCPI